MNYKKAHIEEPLKIQLPTYITLIEPKPKPAGDIIYI